MSNIGSAANCAAVSADTSSAAAGTTPVFGAAAAAFWALTDEPIPCKVPGRRGQRLRLCGHKRHALLLTDVDRPQNDRCGDVRP